MRVLALDQVVLVPVGQAPHREIERRPRGRGARASCASCAAGGRPRLAVSRHRGRARRARPTRRTRWRRCMRGEPDDELVLILGADQAAALPEWHEPEAVLELATVAVAARGGHGARGGPAPAATGSAGRGADRVLRHAAARRLLDAGARAGRRRPADPLSRAGHGGRLHRGERACTRAAATADDAAPARHGPTRPAARLRGAGRPHRRDRLRPQGDRHPRARPARHRGLHGLLRGLLGQHRAPDQGDPRRGLPGAQGRARGCCPAAPRGRARRAGSCSTTWTACCTSSPRGARVLPAGEPLGGGAAAAASSEDASGPMRTCVRAMEPDRNGSDRRADDRCRGQRASAYLRPSGDRARPLRSARSRSGRSCSGPVQVGSSTISGTVVKVNLQPSPVARPSGYVAEFLHGRRDRPAVASTATGMDRCYLLPGRARRPVGWSICAASHAGAERSARVH